jgi:4-hydroxybenzoate polyprenyltransferase
MSSSAPTSRAEARQHDAPASDASGRKPPLVVDLDGTLTPTDTLVESFFALAKSRPLVALRAPLELLKGRAHLKCYVAAHAIVDIETLPIRADVLAYLEKERALGRRIVLATAAHHSIAGAVSDRLGVFDDVIASDKDVNLKGNTKLSAIRDLIGGDFTYAGDSSADLPIWMAAKSAILVGVSAGLARTVRDGVAIEAEFPSARADWRVWLRACRVHQWAKNLLLFVPLLTSGYFAGLGNLAITTLAFIAISLVASATYLTNDLWDLGSDRLHPRKRNRPLASGAISPASGMAAIITLHAAGFALSLAVSSAFAAVLAFYLVVTTIYSMKLKEYVLLDVLTLTALYLIRIFAGALVINVSISSWLLQFAAFTFLSLALVKRCSELVTLDQSGRVATRGRDYRVSDLSVLWPLGVAASIAAIVVFGLFINSSETQARYAAAQLLWFVAFALLYWLSRLWIKASRGEMHDDPLVFALVNRGSQITVVAMIVMVGIARLGVSWWAP